MATTIIVPVNEEEFNRAKKFDSSLGYLMMNIAVLIAPMDTGNLRRSITLTENNEKRKSITYNLMDANYTRFLELGIGPVKRHKGFISVDTTYSIVEAVIAYIKTGSYSFLSKIPKVELKDTQMLFSKEKQILRAHNIKTDKISADVRRRISKLRELEYRQKVGINKFNVSGMKVETTKNFAYGSNKGNNVLSQAYRRNKKAGEKVI